MASKIQIFSSIGYKIFKLIVFLVSIFEPDFFDFIDHDYSIDTIRIRIITILPSIYPPKNKRKK